MTITYLKQRIQNAGKLDFGSIFSESIELFKKSIVHGFVMQIIFLISMIPFFILFYVPWIMAIMAQSSDADYNTSSYDPMLNGLSILTFVLLMVGMIVIGVLVMAMRAGFIRMLKRIDEDRDVSTKEMFYFFKGKYLWKIFLLLLLTILLATVAMLLFVIPIFYVIVPISYFTVIFAFNPELKVGEILSLGFLIGNKKWLISFGLIIVSSLLSTMIGFILCGIGILFTAPFVYHPLYFIYKKVIGFEEIVQNDGFRDSLKERY